jgi:putative FmdB family regulatory protein
MPLYEYECKDCGKKFDMLRTMRDADAPVVCVRCESQRTKRLLSRFNAQSGGHAVAGRSSCNCSGCSGGSCSGCGGH